MLTSHSVSPPAPPCARQAAVRQWPPNGLRHQACRSARKCSRGISIIAHPDLVAGRAKARSFITQYNQRSEQTDENVKKRKELLAAHFGSIGENVWIEPPFYCDYGCNIYIGAGSAMNWNCCVLDCAKVEIGRNVLFGPNVQVYTAHHPVLAAKRIEGPELATGIKIGDNCWIGGSAIILPGVTIGENTTIGAGSVVTKDIPANVVAVGNPCRVIRQL